MLRALTLLALLATTGCASTADWMDRHPRASAAIVTSVALSAGLAIRHDSRSEPRMSTPLVPDCAKYPELCR